MNLPKLTIPKPCHENWGAMTPEDKGRFCEMCQKTVVDFSVMDNREVAAFFEEHKGEKVCGRFRTEQLSLSETPLIPPALLNKIARRPMGFRQMFIVALIVCMGNTLFSCKRYVGEPADHNAVTTIDSSNNRYPEKVEAERGQIDTTAPKPSAASKPTASKKDEILFTIKPHIKGEVAPERPPEKTAHLQGDTIVTTNR